MHKSSLIVFILAGAAFGAAPGGMVPQPSAGYRLLSEVTDEPAEFWMVWWVDAGDLSDVAISNTMQGGLFSRHPDDDHEYRGFPMRRIQTDGKVLEYPDGSDQFYAYAYGFWFGAMYPAEMEGGDTTWEPNVSKAAHYTDMGAMAVPEMANAGSMGDIARRGLYFSDMTIPKGYGFEGEGDNLFVQHGKTPKSYQVLWPFADTMLNERRSPDSLLDPSKGDVVSHQDTYAVGGDWIPDSLATTLWIRHDTVGNYDKWGLGIRAEQRTYSWKRGALANAVVFNYKIRNMNDFPLKAPYFSYFVDPDIGSGGAPGEDGCWDDLVGFNPDHGVGYAYDNNGSESGWSTPTGYVGVVLLGTQDDVGLTGFLAWTSGSVADEVVADLHDSLKYVFMSSEEFQQWHTPSDVRMLVNSGPYPTMEPGDEYDFSVALVMGQTLEELLTNADSVRTAYAHGFPWFDPLAVEETDAPRAVLELELTSSSISNGALQLRYVLPYPSSVELAVFDAAGRRIETLKQGYAHAGEEELTWDASGVAAGVYFVRLATERNSVTERVLIIR